MAIKHTAHNAQHLLDLHGQVMKERGLVLGWATWHREGDNIMETLYTQAVDGKRLVTGPHVRTNEFDRRDRIWTPADEIPEAAEFIGTYCQPIARHA